MAAIENDGVLAQRLIFRRHAGVGEHDAPPTDLADGRGIRTQGAGLTGHMEVIIGRTCRMVGVTRSRSAVTRRPSVRRRTRRVTPRGALRARVAQRGAFQRRFA